MVYGEVPEFLLGFVVYGCTVCLTWPYKGTAALKWFPFISCSSHVHIIYNAGFEEIGISGGSGGGDCRWWC